MNALNACTIVAKNYLPFARVLARSFLEHHPDGRFFVLLIDRVDDCFQPETEPFDLVTVEELDNVPDLDAFLFKYTILESSTAVKPFFMEHLFRRFALPNLCYIDPDILVMRPLAEVAELLGAGSENVEPKSIVLTPHLDEPMPDDDAHPSELTILQAGSANLGFLGLRWTEVTERLLSWWQDRLYDQCLVRIAEGLFVDQKWMDIVPGIFQDSHLLLHPGYNVAYWNLHGREISRDGNSGWLAKGEPLVFFHFSGIDPHHLDLVSKYQSRFVFSDLGLAGELYRHYSELLLNAGYDDCRTWPFAYGRFDNGTVIPDGARELYLSLELVRRRRFGNPFQTEGSGSYWRWMNGPVDGGKAEAPYLTRLQKHLWSTRPDLQEDYPDVEGKQFTYFCSWLLDTGRYEFKLDDGLLDTVHRETRATLLTAGGIKRRLKNRWQRFDHSETGKKLKRTIKRALGHKRSKAVRRKIRGDRPVVTADAIVEARRHRLRAPRRLDKLGVNLVGYLDAETGMGEAARSLARAFETTDVPVSLHSIDLNVLARRDDPTYRFVSPAIDGYFPHDVNLFVINADQVGQVYQHLGAEVFGGRYNVGLWLWELEVFPDDFRDAFDVLHEIWTPSTFCLEAISQISPIPVRRMPLPVEPLVDDYFDRVHFGLPEDAFVCLFMFNYLSHFERKNPRAVIQAFQEAFGDDDSALLVLKTAHSDFAPEAAAELAEACHGTNVRLLDEYLSRDEIRSLTRVCDTYVSLHRSEGFGLTLAEAMYYGKPVVATGYSGVTNFFDFNNGLPVDYELVELGDDEGPYPAGARWAQPSPTSAASALKRLHDDPTWRRELGEKARRSIHRDLSLEAVGRRLTTLFHGIVRETARRSAGRPTPT